MYTRETHELLCGTIFRKRTAFEAAEKASNIAHAGLLLAFFLGGILTLGPMGYERLVDVSIAFIVIIMFSGIFAQSFFEKLDEKGISVEISELRSVLGQFLSENEVNYLLGTGRLSGKIRLKSLEIFSVYNELKTEVQENVPEDMEDEIFFERMQKYYRDLPEIMENEKNYEIDLGKEDLLYNRKRLVKRIRALRRYRRIEERMKEKRNAVRLMKKNKVQPGKQGIACAPPTSVPWKIKEACEQEIKDVKERVKNGQKQENAQDD